MSSQIMMDPHHSSSLLSQIKRGIIKKPVLLLIHGLDGVGKSTFASDSPSPIFLGTEKGTSNLDVARFPTPKNFREVLQAINELADSNHDFKTLVIDSLDWLEHVVWGQVCSDSGKANIEEVGGGYGKGYIAANKLWLEMISRLNHLQESKTMNVILIAHTQVKTFQDPQTSAGYDRYQLKLNEKAASLFREYVDCVLFATYEVFTKSEKGRTRAFGEGARVMFTERRPAFDAKNRIGLPFQIPLSWEEFIKASELGQSESPDLLKQNIKELLSQITDKELREKVSDAVTKAGADATQLEKIQNRLRSRLAG